jgi:hypothetical protein
MFEDRIIQDIIDAWQHDQDHPGRERRQVPIPDFDSVRVLIETAFLASLKREEDRSIPFSLSLLQRDEIDEEQRTSGRSQLVMNFEITEPLSVESILKLAPAFDPDMTSLAVERRDDGAQYQIWGALNYSPTTNRFREIPVVIPELIHTRPDVLTLSVRQPGSLLVSRAYNQIGRFVGGEFIRATPWPFASESMGSFLIRAVHTHSLYNRSGNEYWFIYRDALGYLLSEVTSRSHGATIVLIPQRSLQHYEHERRFTFEYRFSRELGLRDLFIRLIEGPPGSISGQIALRKLIKERLQLLAQLAAIDGALLLTDELDLISFGVTLNAPVWEGTVLIGPDAFGGGGDIFAHTKLGTRHSSTIDFIGKCPDCVAFVVSEDGPIRGIVQRDSSTLLCWPDCTESMFV